MTSSYFRDNAKAEVALGIWVEEVIVDGEKAFEY